MSSLAPRMITKATLPPDPASIFSNHQPNWYVESRFYWSIQEPTVEAMCQGSDEISTIDLRFTFALLTLLKSENRFKGGRVADCGGGIGRVSFQVLSHFFDKIDIIDPIPHFLLKAREQIEKDLPIEVIQAGLEEWKPATVYDAYYVQWTLCYLTDADAVAFLKRCREKATDKCVFIIKENVAGLNMQADKSEYEFYPDKNALCRTHKHFLQLFREAGLMLEEYRVQPNWPKDSLAVVIFVLKK